MRLLISQLPKMARSLVRWRLAYKLSQDGVDGDLLFRRIAGYNNTILIFKDNHRVVFGGFGTEKWAKEKGYFGNRETFVFRINPKTSSLEVFPYKQLVNYFQYSEASGFGWGGGGGTAIHISSGLRDGVSQWAGTYQNPVLAGADSFNLYELEAWVAAPMFEH